MIDRHTQWLREEGLDKPRRPRAPKRKHISLSDKLAALLCLRRRPDGRPLIPDAVRAKGKAAVLAYPIDWDHVIALGLCGPDVFDNLVPVDKTDHKIKTRADKKRMAHNDRVAKAEAEFRARLLAPTVRENRTVQSRPMPGSKASGFKHRMDGKWEKRP